MKKIFTILLVTVLLCGCAKAPEASKPVTTGATEATIPEETSETATVAITYSVIEESTEEKEEESEEAGIANEYKFDIVPDHEAASDLATVIFNYAEKPEGTESYKVANVGLDYEEDTWVVLFSDGSMEQIILAEVNFCNISIERKTGRVIGLFFRTAEEQDEINKQNNWGNYAEGQRDGSAVP